MAASTADHPMMDATSATSTDTATAGGLASVVGGRLVIYNTIESVVDITATLVDNFVTEVHNHEESISTKKDFHKPSL